MTIKLKVLTPTGFDVNALIKHIEHVNDFVPHGSRSFDLKDTADHVTAHASGSGFSYLFDIPISGTVSQIVIDKGSTHSLNIGFVPGLSVSTLLSSFGNFFQNHPITFTGNVGNDTFKAGHKADTLNGGKGNDHLNGNLGNDHVIGGLGNDTLKGDSGNDWLVGGTGKDLLAGGFGSDRFTFKSITDSTVGVQHDTIKDFSHSQGDHIDLAVIDADTTAAGDQAFSFVGASAFTSVAGELRYAAGLLQGDTNGDGVADFEVHLTVASLVAGDFFL
jgi:Ca2+-binding RTX toxin-like protein